MQTDINVHHTLDTTGLICPEPIMLLHQSIRKVSSGECVLVLATDPATQRDIPNFCRHLGHQLYKQSEQQAPDNGDEQTCYRYWVVKK